MADFLEEFNKLIEVAGREDLGKLQDGFRKSVEQAERLKISVSDLSGVLGKSNEKIKEKQAELLKLQEVQKQAIEKIREFGGSNAVASTQIDLANNKLKNMFDSISIGGGGINKAISAFGDLSRVIENNASLSAVFASDFAKNIVDPSKDFNLPLGDKFNKFNESIKNMLATQAPARVAFISLGDSIGEANEKTTEYIRNLSRTQAHLGMTRESQKAFNSAVVEVPGIFDLASDSFRESVGLQNTLTSTSGILQTALQRFGFQGAEAGQRVRTAFLESGMSAAQFSDFLGQANAALRGTDINAKLAFEQMERINSSMGILGSQASRSASIWHDFATALRTSGVAANQVGKIVESVTSGIVGMSTQNRAFISMMSGMFRGATAIGGALRMELAMRTPGGMEQNLEALTSTLARFGGGRIITLEQAANNPQLENQFVVQRQMLQKLGIAGTAQQQNRILEVLQGVKEGGVSRITAGKELKDVMEKGRNIQEQMITSIDRLGQMVREVTISEVGSRLGNIYNKLEDFTRVFGIGREGAKGTVPMERTPVGAFGAGLAAKSETLKEQMGNAFGELIKDELRNVFTPGQLTSEYFEAKNRELGASPFLRRIGGLSMPEEMTAAQLPKTPGLAALPKVETISTNQIINTNQNIVEKTETKQNVRAEESKIIIELTGADKNLNELLQKEMMPWLEKTIRQINTGIRE